MGSSPTRGVLLCLVVCLTLLASFFLLISHLKTCTMYTLRGEEERKEEASKQHSTPKAVTFPKKDELPRVGLEPTTLYTLDRSLYQLSYRDSSAGWAQILTHSTPLLFFLPSHLIKTCTCTLYIHIYCCG